MAQAAVRRALAERLASVLRDYAEAQEISLDVMAQRLSVSRSTLFNWVGSSRRRGSSPRATSLPRMEDLRSISAVTGASIDFLLGFDAKPRNDERLAHIRERRRLLRAAIYDTLIKSVDEDLAVVLSGRIISNLERRLSRANLMSLADMLS